MTNEPSLIDDKATLELLQQALKDYKQRVHWLNEDLLNANAKIKYLEAELRRLETELHK